MINMKKYIIIPLLLFILIFSQCIYAEENNTNENNMIINENTMPTNDNYGVNNHNEEKNIKTDTLSENPSINNLQIKYQPNPVNYSIHYPKTKTQINISNYTYYHNSKNLIIEGNVIGQRSNDANFTLQINNYEKLKKKGNKIEDYYPIFRKNNGNFIANIKVDINESFNVTLNYPETLVEYPSNVTINIDNFKKDYIISAYAGERIEEFFPIVDENYEKINEGYVIYKLNGLTLKNKMNDTIQSNVINGSVHLNYLIPYTFKSRNYTLEIVYINEKAISKSFRNRYTISLYKHNISMTTNVTISKNIYESSILIRPSLLIDGKTPKKGYLIAKINDVTLKDKFKNTRVINYPLAISSMLKYNESVPVPDYLNKNFDVDIRDSWRGKTLKITVLYSLNNYGRIETTNYCTLSSEKLNTSIVFDNIIWTNKSVHLQGNIITKYLNRNAVGKNILCIKLNSITLKDSNNKPIKFEVNDGKIDIEFKIPDNYKSDKYNLTITSGERKHYNSIRTSRSINNINPHLNLNNEEQFLYKYNQIKERTKEIKYNISININRIKWTNKTVQLQGNIINDKFKSTILEQSIIILKLNSITLKDSNNKTIKFEANIGKIDIEFKIPDNYKSNSYNLTIIVDQTIYYNSYRKSIMIYKNDTLK